MPKIKKTVMDDRVVDTIIIDNDELWDADEIRAAFAELAERAIASLKNRKQRSTNYYKALHVKSSRVHTPEEVQYALDRAKDSYQGKQGYNYIHTKRILEQFCANL